MEERVIVKLFLVNESYMTQLRATEFSIDVSNCVSTNILDFIATLGLVFEYIHWPA